MDLDKMTSPEVEAVLRTWSRQVQIDPQALLDATWEQIRAGKRIH